MKSKKMDSSFDIGFNYYSNRNYRSYLNYQSYLGAKIIFFFETYKKRQIFPLAKEAYSKSPPKRGDFIIFSQYVNIDHTLRMVSLRKLRRSVLALCVEMMSRR